MSGNQRFSITPSAAAEDTTLPDSVFRTLACLGVFGDKNGWCWPSLETLATMRGVSKPRISQDIKILVERGYVQKQAQFKNNEQQTNKYRLLFDMDGLTTGVNGGLTTEINTGLTPAVKGGLTPVVNQNAPINALINDIDPIAKKLSDLKCRFNPNTRVIIQGWKDDFSDDIIMRAIDEAATRGKVSLPYIDQIIISWKVNGVPKTREERAASKKPYQPKTDQRVGPPIRSLD